MQSKLRNWSKRVPWIALIALYGAVLSTYQLLDSRAEKARHLDVSLYFDAPIAKGLQFQRGLCLKATNPGYQEVTVVAAGLLLPDGSRILVQNRPSSDWQVPLRIPPGENRSVLWVGQDLSTLCDRLVSRGFNGKVRLIGFFADGEDRSHKSTPLQFGIDEALKLVRAQATSPSVRENQWHSQQ